MSTTKHQHALAWMRSHLGQGEQPPGSNDGPLIRECFNATWLAGRTRLPWCVASFMRAWKAAGVTLPWLGCGAYAFLDWARTVEWSCSYIQAVPGDAVILNVGAGHCAMLAAPVGADHKVHTINGNWGDRVAEHTFELAQVRGFVHIPADPTTVKRTPPARPKAFEVVTSASGHSKLVYVSGPKAIGRKLPKLLGRFGQVTIRPRRRAR